MKIAVTGGSGKLGRTVVAVLGQAGHEVVNFDAVGRRGQGLLRVDLTNFGETIDALFGENDPSAGGDQNVRGRGIWAPSICRSVRSAKKQRWSLICVTSCSGSG